MNEEMPQSEPKKAGALLSPKTRHTVMRVSLWFLAVFVTLALIMQIAFLSGIGWLNSDSGSLWVEHKLKSALSETGYDLEFEGFHYSFPNGIAVQNLEIKDKQGTFLTIDYAALGIAFSPLMVKNLSVSLHADHAALLRTPGKTNDTKETKKSGLHLQPFSLPDMYFTGLTVNKIKIETLELAEPVLGTELSLPLEFYADINLNNDHIGGTVKAGLDRYNAEKFPWLPYNTSVKFGFIPSSSQLTLKEALLRSPAYNINITGKTILRENEEMEINLQGAASDLSVFSESIAGNAKIKAHVTGSPEAPLLNARGTLDLKKAKEKGFTPVEFAVETKPLTGTPEGTVTLKSSYEKSPVHIQTPYTYQNKMLRLSDIKLTMKETDFNGAAQIDIENDIYDVQIQEFTTEDFNIERLKAHIEKTPEDIYAVSLSGAGTYREPLTVEGRAKINPDGPNIDGINLTLAVNGNTAKLKGHYKPDNVDLSLQASKLPLSTLRETVPPALLGMTMNGNITLKGNPAAPLGNADITFSPVRLHEDAPEVLFKMTAGYQNENLQVNLTGRGESIETLNARAETRMVFALDPFIFDIPKTAPLNGALKARMQTGPLADIMLPAAHNFEGLIKAGAALQGTLENPEFEGELTLRNGTYVYKRYDVQLRNVALDGRFTSDNLVVENLKADDGKAGRIEGKGRIDLSGHKIDTHIELNAKDIHLLRGDRADGTVSGKLALDGSGEDYRLTGKIIPQHLEINIPEKFSGKIPELNVVKKEEFEKGEMPETFESKVALDLLVVADNRVFIRGWGLDAELGGRIKVTGTAQDPLFNGSLNLIRGRYEEFGKRFDMEKAALSFRGEVPPSPYLDVVAQTQAEDITAYISLTGSVESPAIKFSSVPGLPEDEVLSRILFGRDISDISPFQAVQLAQTLRRFSGNGGGAGFNPIGQIRDLTGLDDLRVETGDEGGTTIGAGKYINDRIYLGVEKGTLEKSGAATLEFELTPDITIESEVGQDAQAGGGIFWEWDY